jgi:hypothetical protein
MGSQVKMGGPNPICNSAMIEGKIWTQTPTGGRKLHEDGRGMHSQAKKCQRLLANH